jgi:hypothetical protein
MMMLRTRVFLHLHLRRYHFSGRNALPPLPQNHDHHHYRCSIDISPRVVMAATNMDHLKVYHNDLLVSRASAVDWNGNDALLLTLMMIRPRG